MGVFAQSVCFRILYNLVIRSICLALSTYTDTYPSPPGVILPMADLVNFQLISLNLSLDEYKLRSFSLNFLDLAAYYTLILVYSEG